MSLNQQIDAHKIHSGWLWKQGYYNTSWKKRYFVLYDDRTIHYFAKESHALNRSKAKGKIHLTQIRRVELVQYIDPMHKSSSHLQSSSSNLSHKLYRKSSLPNLLSHSSPQHIDDNNKYNNNNNRQNRKHHRNTQSHSHITSLSPNILTSFSFQDPVSTLTQNRKSKTPKSKTPKSRKKSKSKSKSKSKLKSKKSDKIQARMQRASTIDITSEYGSYEDNQFRTISPLQSISEKDTMEGITSLSPYKINNHFPNSTLSPVNGVNGWSFQGSSIIDDNYYVEPSNIVSSSQPPPDYHKIIEMESNLRAISRPRVPITRRTRNRTKSATQVEIKKDIPLMLQSSFPSLDDKVECELNENENKNKNKNKDKDMIVSSDIKQYHEYNRYNITESKRDEFQVFQNVIDDTRLGLSCNRRYSFSLIHPNREYILSAETNNELKEWIGIFSKLSQGKPIYSGYLALKDKKKDKNWYKKFFILFENKILNYYKDHNDVNNGNACEFDIDLRHIMWLRYCNKNEFNQIDLSQYFGYYSNIPRQRQNESSYYLPTNTPFILSSTNKDKISNNNNYKIKSHSVYSLEIAIPNRLFIITAESQRIRNEWYNQIRNIFPDTLILKRYYDSSVINIKMIHNGQIFKNRYIALFEGIGLVIFPDKKKLDTIKRMTFFDELRFRDYIKKQNCTIIPINDNVKVRASNSKNIGFAFVISNFEDDRKWYFTLEQKKILDHWLHLLIDKRSKKQNKSLDLEIESSLTIQTKKRMELIDNHSNSVLSSTSSINNETQIIDYDSLQNSLQNTQSPISDIYLSPIPIKKKKKQRAISADISNSNISIKNINLDQIFQKQF